MTNAEPQPDNERNPDKDPSEAFENELRSVMGPGATLSPVEMLRHDFRRRVEEEGWLELDMRAASSMIETILPAVNTYLIGKPENIKAEDNREFKLRLISVASDKEGMLHLLASVFVPGEDSETLTPLSSRGIFQETHQSPADLPTATIFNIGFSPLVGPENTQAGVNIQVSGNPVYPLPTYESILGRLGAGVVGPQLLSLAESATQALHPDCGEIQQAEWNYERGERRINFLLRDDENCFYSGRLNLPRGTKSIEVLGVRAIPESAEPPNFDAQSEIIASSSVFAMQQEQLGYKSFDANVFFPMQDKLHALVEHSLSKNGIQINPERLQIDSFYSSADGNALRLVVGAFDEQLDSYVALPGAEQLQKDDRFSGFVIDIGSFYPSFTNRQGLIAAIEEAELDEVTELFSTRISQQLVSIPFAAKQAMKLTELDDDSYFAPLLRDALGVDSLEVIDSIRIEPELRVGGFYGLAISNSETKFDYFCIPYLPLQCSIFMNTGIEILSSFET